MFCYTTLKVTNNVPLRQSIFFTCLCSMYIVWENLCLINTVLFTLNIQYIVKCILVLNKLKVCTFCLIYIVFLYTKHMFSLIMYMELPWHALTYITDEFMKLFFTLFDEIYLLVIRWSLFLDINHVLCWEKLLSIPPFI